MNFKKIRTLRIISQSIFLGYFSFIFFRSLDPFSNLTNPFLRFDPVILLSNISTDPVRISIIMGIILFTILLGRFFCGWICPLGFLIDLIDLIKSKIINCLKRRSIKTNNGGKKVVFTEFFSLYPPSIFLLGIVLVTVFTTIPLFQFLHPGIWMIRIFALHNTGIAFAVFLFALSFISKRFWCRYLCPLGALYGLFSNFSIFKLRITNCTSCGLCSSCPMGAILEGKNYVVHSQCILCFEFESKCPKEGFKYGKKASSHLWFLLWQRAYRFINNSLLKQPGGDSNLTIGSKLLRKESYNKKIFNPVEAQSNSITGINLFHIGNYNEATPDQEGSQSNSSTREKLSHRVDYKENPPKQIEPESNLITRRKFLRTGMIIAGSIAIGFALPSSTRGSSNGLLRPPGVIDEIGFVKKCLRCQQCVRSCPNGIIMPTGLSTSLEEGLGSLYTPHLNFSIYGCDYYCQVCQIVCPNNAIPLQSLEEKQKTRIGTARIDKDLCIVYKEKKNCIVCEEFCPLPQKAINLIDKVYYGYKGKVKLRHPEVDKDLCIGCGICEAMCPVEEKAIRVYKKV